MEEKTVIMSELELVSKYGTKGQKASYKKEGHFVSDNKRRVLERANASCKVEEISDRKYKVTILYDSKGDELNALKKSKDNLYKYMCPLILKALKKSEGNRLVLSYYSIARTIELINEYYKVVENNKYVASQCLDVDVNVVDTFYGRVSSMVNNFIEKAINYLWQMKIISYDKVHLAQHYEDVPSIEGRSVHIKHGKYVPMTEKEKYWFDKAAKLADKMCGIENESVYSRYCGKNAQRWKNIVDIEMSKHDIVNAIWAYDMHIADKERCKEYLQSFEDDKEFPKKLALEFRQRINDNAKKDYDRSPDKYKKLMLCSDKEFLEDYEFISKIVIDQTSGVDESVREYQEELKQRCFKKNDSYTTVVERGNNSNAV